MFKNQNSNHQRNFNDSQSKSQHFSNGDLHKKQRNNTPDFGSSYYNDFEVKNEVPHQRMFTQSYE